MGFEGRLQVGRCDHVNTGAQQQASRCQVCGVEGGICSEVAGELRNGRRHLNSVQGGSAVAQQQVVSNALASCTCGKGAYSSARITAKKGRPGASRQSISGVGATG